MLMPGVLALSIFIKMANKKPAEKTPRDSPLKGTVSPDF
jgi:hypothetical protein